MIITMQIALIFQPMGEWEVSGDGGWEREIKGR